MRDVTITGLEYLAAVEVTAAPSPFELAQARLANPDEKDERVIHEAAIAARPEPVFVESVIDSFVVTFDAGPLTGHQLYFRPEAIANRMAGYDLATEEAAILALVRETVFRWDPELQPEDPADRAQANGGVDERIAVAYGKDAPDAAETVRPLKDRAVTPERLKEIDRAADRAAAEAVEGAIRTEEPK